MVEEKVSIITPAYNAARYVRETIRSVQSQTHENWEMWIVDDCSKDETVRIIEEEIRKDPRIHLIALNENGGPAHARNTALQAANGRYIAFLDSDDVWKPNKLSRQLELMKEHQAAFSFTSYRIMSEDGIQSDVVFHVPQQVSYQDLLKNTSIGTLTVVIDQKAIGPLRMPLYRDCSEDFGFWLSILSQGITALGIDEELAVYRKCDQSLSSNKWKSARKTWNTYRKVGKITIPHSMWYFANYSFHAFKKHSRTS
ncbi:glycosyltransferase family 2 protein [Halobacillus locisalis]|uniref:Glycosyltransferase family 2 protein n=1 Tax=Halobacillus locisalis TaxID=220753 RepID=A0A838CWP2_9BACI|nr:glycosyltransferase family 2 protein [Halobacillus locisalis]MBA2176348.1 glycosyltransferase family 2 protein [Halobacillus locisalis]